MKATKQYGDWQQPHRNFELKFRIKSTKEQKTWIHQNLKVGESLSVKQVQNPQRIDVYAQEVLIGEIPARLYPQISSTQRFVRRFEVSEVFYKGLQEVEAVEVLWSCAPEVKSTLEVIDLVPVEIKKTNTIGLIIDIIAIVVSTILIIFNLNEPGNNLWLALGVLIASLLSFAVHIKQRN